MPTFIHTEYVVNGDMLYIKSGYLPVIKVDIHTINFISRTKTSIPFLYPKGYVLSIDSITLHYENKKFSISPYDQKGFINELTKHNPYIKVISVGS